MTNVNVRHDGRAIAQRLVVNACSSQSAVEARRSAIAGEEGMVESQRSAAIVAVPPQLERGPVALVVTHASALLYATHATQEAGWMAARTEQTKWTR